MTNTARAASPRCPGPGWARSPRISSGSVSTPRLA